MAMPDKARWRPLLVMRTERAQELAQGLEAVMLGQLLLALADAEWAREEAAAKQAATLPPPPA